MAADLQQLVDMMVTLDEDSIVTVITSVLQARPECSPPVVNFAVPDLTYPPQKALVERRSTGYIKSFNDQKGFGFIDCEELATVFGNDVFLHVGQMAGCTVGMQVNFAVMLNKDNKPQAYDLQPMGKGGCKGKGCGKDGFGKEGYGKDGYGKDGYKGGDMGGMMMMMGKGCKGGKDGGGGKGKGGEKCGGGGGGGQPRDVMEVLGEKVGVIKSFNPHKGYGFIECAEIKEQYGADVFLNHHQLREFQVGDTVQFCAYLNNSGKPQGKDLQEASHGAKRQRPNGDDLGPFY
mmetsp:Transcript_50674/g.127675  ORF Transcript_50674/g.127675 Transcript_50674/m.127675 type:complete len:290 (+) Transcript_50674:89-958(+)|eukprot:CAMPEP_0115242684 /NCGR_PEP_ID=MMETSP0270-20121206/39081_1 /TAXON_ID=71861 /ORGANISM="Scrippsiella trochoidea, Strain CCMP3099" /LENGTH=289 /DNA_ID=CAMNT_0002657761 /DNA_START=67 /DNA_END=936 /DNA_ORIENTATION=+